MSAAEGEIVQQEHIFIPVSPIPPNYVIISIREGAAFVKPAGPRAVLMPTREIICHVYNV